MATKSNLFNESVKKSATATLGKDKGFINPNAKTSMVSRASGSTTLNNGIYAQFKCDKASGVVTQIALQSVVNSVQHELSTSDLIVNRHKLNSQLYEFTNLKANMGTIMGGLTVNSTVLVKAWEPTLQQYVLIRRPARFAPFSNILDAYKIDDRLYLGEELGFMDELEKVKKELNDLKEDKLKDDMEEAGENIQEGFEELKEDVGDAIDKFKETDFYKSVSETINEYKDKVVSFFSGEDTEDTNKDETESDSKN